MKRFIAKYLLYIYLNFIQEDLSIYKKNAIPFIKVLSLLNNVGIWIISILFFPFFLIGMKIDEIINDENVHKNKNIYVNNK